ncbi:MAG: hypothetical protein KF764_17790 [Labilithrix sp.]|nr:hypothetical protein [Labilithrix sp.]
MRLPSFAVVLGSTAVGVSTLVAGGARADDVAAAKPPPTAGASAAAPAATSRPIDAEVTTDTAAQFYEMRSPTGQTVISRRRLTSTLGVAVYDLFDKVDDPLAPTITFRARLRYDADYGGSADETSLDRADRLVPGFSRGPVDLMYGYIEGRRFFKGLLGFRLGRQYVTDALGWWSFDGGQVKVTTPYFFALEAYGGLEQRGGLPLSTSRYERDGVWRGDRTGYERDPSLYPSFQPSDIAPAIGAALESAGFNWLHGRLTYRRVYNTGGSNVAQFASGLRAPARYDGTRISQERVGYAVEGTLPTLGGVKAGFAYDLYVKQMANVFASLDWYTSNKLTLSVDYDYFRPTFDADSIWNFFMAMPMNDVGLRASWDPHPRVGVAGGLRARAFTLQTEPEKHDVLPGSTSPNGLADANYYPSGAIDPMGGANLSGRYRIGDGHVGARGVADIHRSGDRIGMDVYGERTLETRYVLQARSGVWHWNDKLRADRDATNFGYVLGVGYKLFPRSLVLADFQHDMNRIAGQRFRAMLWLTVALAN